MKERLDEGHREQEFRIRNPYSCQQLPVSRDHEVVLLGFSLIRVEDWNNKLKPLLQGVQLLRDDEAEWLPNPEQSSAFGISVDEEMATAWQAVWVEISDVLEGKALIPHWRVGAGRGARQRGT